MTGWPWTVRARLWLMSALTAIALGAMAVIDHTTTAHSNARLVEIEQNYLPLLEYGPTLEVKLGALRRAMQDAVTAQDREALLDTRAMREEILADLASAPRVVEPQALAAARRAFLAWDDAAYALSGRLLVGETGEPVVAAVEDMHGKQRTAWSEVRRACFLDRARLSGVFDDTRQTQAAAARTRTAVRVALIAAITILALATSRRIVRAFDKLRAGFGRFGHGRFDEPVEITGQDELAELGRHANQMAASLRELQDGLRAKQAELEQVNRELETFSYSVSHDLRAPLRSIDGFSQALLEDYGGSLDATGQDYLRRVRAAAQRMAELIDDLLSLSRVGRAELIREQVDLGALVRRVAQRLRETAPDRHVDWVIASQIEANADPRLLTVALENLLGNAWKFTGKLTAARIEFGEQSHDGKRIYFVRDNGAGFDMTYAHKLFTPFQRLHTEREFEGTGIGLATVNRIVRRHGGQVWAESERDRGATFYFTLS